MSEANFYLYLLSIIHRRKFPLKTLSVGLTEIKPYQVALLFENVPFVVLDSDIHTLRTYENWFEKVKNCT